MIEQEQRMTTAARLNRRCESYRLACLDVGLENDQRLVTELAQASPRLAALMAERLSGSKPYQPTQGIFGESRR
jgi:hypothetical protein